MVGYPITSYSRVMRGYPMGTRLSPNVLETPLDPRIPKDEKWGTPVEDLILVSICATDPTKTIKIGSNILEEQQRTVILLVK